MKVYVLDLEISTRAKKLALSIGVPLALLLGGGVAFAGVPVTFADGQVLTAKNLNDNFSYLQSVTHPASAFRATRTTALNVPNATSTPVVFDNALYDLANEYNPATGVFTPKNAGIYMITCGFMFGATATNATFTATIQDGTSEVDGVDTQSSVANYGIRPTLTTMAKLSAGASVSCAVFQTTGVSQPLDLLQQRNTFSVARLY